MTDDTSTAPALEYLRRLYANVMDWYKAADAKAQVLLAVNGALVSIIGIVAFGVPSQLVERLGVMSMLTRAMLVVSALFIISSIAAGVMAIYANLSNARLSALQKGMRINPDDSSTYSPESMWWFGFIGQIVPSRRLNADAYARRKLLVSEFLRQNGTAEFEAEALSSQIVILADHTLTKFRRVNAGWMLYAIGLAFFMSFVSAYMADIVL